MMHEVVVTITVSRMLSATCAATGGRAKKAYERSTLYAPKSTSPIDDGMLCGRAIARSSPHLSSRPIEHSSSASLSVQRSGRVAHRVSSSSARSIAVSRLQQGGEERRNDGRGARVHGRNSARR